VEIQQTENNITQNNQIAKYVHGFTYILKSLSNDASMIKNNKRLTV